MIEKKHRIEDALEAVRSAQEQGIVSGGTALPHALKTLEIDFDNDEQHLGGSIIREAITCTFKQMCSMLAKAQIDY